MTSGPFVLFGNKKKKPMPKGASVGCRLILCEDGEIILGSRRVINEVPISSVCIAYLFNCGHGGGHDSN